MKSLKTLIYIIVWGGQGDIGLPGSDLGVTQTMWCDVGRGCSLRDIVFSSLPTALMLKAFPFVCVKVDPENRVGVTVKKYSPKI